MYIVIGVILASQTFFSEPKPLTFLYQTTHGLHKQVRHKKKTPTHVTHMIYSVALAKPVDVLTRPVDVLLALKPIDLLNLPQPNITIFI